MSDVPLVHASRSVDPFDLIREISQAIDYGEITKDPYAFIKARKLLNNDLVEAIKEYEEAKKGALLWELSHHHRDVLLSSSS
jgi:hypothetical protein